MKPYHDPGWYRVVVHFPDGRVSGITVRGDSVGNACTQAWTVFGIPKPYPMNEWPATKTYYYFIKGGNRKHRNNSWLFRLWLHIGRLLLK